MPAALALIAAVVAAAFGVAALAPALSPLIAAMFVGALAAPVLRHGCRLVDAWRPELDSGPEGMARPDDGCRVVDAWRPELDSGPEGMARPPGARGLRGGCRIVDAWRPQLDSDRVAVVGRWLLRAGIVLLGLRISLGDLAGLGAGGLAIAAGTLVATLGATLLLAPRLRVDRDLALLIGAGSAICGASAIAAMQPLTRARDADVGYAVATVTLFGTLAMLAIPVAGPALDLDARATGLWAGAAIHEVAQVAAAGAAISAVGLQLATLVKLGRVALLAPAVAAISTLRGTTGTGEGGRPAAPVHAFVLAFLSCVVARTVLPIPAAALEAADLAATLLLAGGLAALGLGIRPAALRAAGPRPLLLALAASATAAAVALALVAALG